MTVILSAEEYRRVPPSVLAMADIVIIGSVVIKASNIVGGISS